MKWLCRQAKLRRSKTPPSKVSGGSTCARLCPQGYEGIPMDKEETKMKRKYLMTPGPSPVPSFAREA
ncbi:MAG: hypothetical protein KKG50_02185, partial [Candidatus Omnitrophica bacterium]|nr:hypothetical protein [Candidatus Omnitrophota bacterium]